MIIRRKAILFIHGFVGGTYDFGTFYNELEVYNNFDVYTYTLKSHNKIIVNNVKYQEWIDESVKQVEFLINNGYKKIYLIGHSMGGVIATHLASKYPKYIKKLVLVAPAFRYFYFKDGKFNIKNFNQTIKNIPELFKTEDTEEIIQRILKTPIPTIIEFTKLVNHYQNDVNNIYCPTLIIRGNNDTIVPKESVEFAHNNIKSSTNILINMDKITHDCFTKKRNKELKDIIINFLKKHPKKIKEIQNI